jgi:hypothetical protein
MEDDAEELWRDHPVPVLKQIPDGSGSIAELRCKQHRRESSASFSRGGPLWVAGGWSVPATTR